MSYFVKKFMKHLILFFVLMFFAENIYSLVINPSRLYKNIKINKKISGEYTITNDEQYPLEITISKTDDSEWFLLDEQKFILKVGKSKSVKYEMLTKDSKLQGEHRSGMMVNQRIIAKEKQTSGAAFQTRFRLPVYIMIGGTENLDYDVEKIDFNGAINKRKDDGVLAGKIISTIDIKNIGNVHYMCDGRMETSKVQQNGQRELIDTKRLNLPKLVFADKKEKITFDKTGEFEPGVYEAKVFLYFGFDKDLKKNDDLLKKEKVYNKIFLYSIEENGKFTLIEQN